jgi:cytosine/adenosine deaminase-related metal-dependent hydrolase
LVLIGLAILGWFSQARFIGRCAADEGAPRCAISGHIVTDDGAYPGWVVFDPGEGTILDICDRQEDVPPAALVIKHSGYVFPGLIDTHNHCHWNSVPMWRPGRTFNNRYEWRGDDGDDPALLPDPEYVENVAEPYRSVTDAGLWAISLYYGETRALIGGTTMIQGTNNAYPGSLVRNLENYSVYSVVGDVTLGTPADIAYVRFLLKAGYINRLFLHVAEGKRTDLRSWAEFQFLDVVGLTMPGVVVIHGLALTDDDFATMAETGMYLVWSPKSNLVLYGETADVVGALAAGVTLALAPDWSISGSDNLLEELKVAYQYSVEHLDGIITPRQLFKMATSDAAKVAGIDDPSGEGLGRIEVGYQADLFLAPKFHPDPHVSLLKTYPKDIDLVFVDGTPVCGKRQSMEKWFAAESLDEIVVNHTKKAAYFSWKRYAEVVGLLDWALEEMAPLIEDEPGSQPGFPRSLP